MSSPSQHPALVLRDVELAAGSRTLLRGLSLAAAPGEIIAIVGPSGSGKSTLLRALVRLEDRASGEVHLGGSAIDELPPTLLRRRMALVAQRPVLLGPTVLDDLAAGAQGVQGASTAGAQLLEELGLAAAVLGTPVEGLSGGEQARVAIARALLMDPQVLLLDEPSAALDEAATDALARVLTGRTRSGLAIIAVTHDPQLVGATSARVVDLADVARPRAA